MQLCVRIDSLLTLQAQGHDDFVGDPELFQSIISAMKSPVHQQSSFAMSFMDTLLKAEVVKHRTMDCLIAENTDYIKAIEGAISHRKQDETKMIRTSLKILPSIVREPDVPNKLKVAFSFNRAKFLDTTFDMAVKLVILRKMIRRPWVRTTTTSPTI